LGGKKKLEWCCAYAWSWERKEFKNAAEREGGSFSTKATPKGNEGRGGVGRVLG